MIQWYCPVCDCKMWIEHNYGGKFQCPTCDAYLFMDYDEYWDGEDEYPLYSVYAVSKEDWDDETYYDVLKVIK